MSRWVAAPVIVLVVLLCPAAAEAKKSPAFKREWLVPYLAQGREAEARQALLAGEPERAAKVLRRALRRKRLPHRVQAQYLLAHALLESDEPEAAAQLFAALERSYPLLLDYHLFYGAQCLYRLRRFAEAEAKAAKVAADAALKRDAELVRADALRALSRHKEVATLWKAFLKRYPGAARVGQAHLRVAEALEQLAQAAKKPDEIEALRAEALEHYKQVTIKAPLSPHAPTAEQRLAALAGQVKDGKEKARLTLWQRFGQAMEYYRAMRHERTEPALAELLKLPDLSPRLQCKATYYLAKTAFRRRERARAAPIFARAADLCRKAGEQDLVVKSLYNGAKGLMRAHKFDEAIAEFGRIEKEFPRHSYADDARLWAAEAAEAGGKQQQAQQLLDTLPERYPRGDMTREALWRLARAAMLAKDHKQALRQLDRALEDLGRARYYYAHGQALYWKARILDQLKQRVQARQLYEQCIREYPLSYYALMAFNRLRERHVTQFRKLYRELIAPVGQRAGTWTFERSKLFGEPGFLRGVELARLGFAAAAAAEFARVGVGIRRGVPTDDLWLAAVLFDRAGLHELSHQVPRSLDSAYKRSYPLGDAYRRWVISYPRAFRPLVHASGRRAGVPAQLIWAVMREESGFSTKIESWANAVGLMQLLVRTARKAGNEHKLEVTRKRLHDPAVNIKLGATYLGFLRRTFGDNPALAIAGYNAGEGAALRWLRNLKGTALDEFIDRIPYDQTRRYTKRVLSSLFAYSVLYNRGTARVPRLGQKLPAAKRVAFGRRAKAKKVKKAKRKRAKRR
jgi:soluble lytic murein transglycosylase